MEKIAYNPTEAAQALGICKTRIYELIKANNDFPAVKVSPNRYLIPCAGLERWLLKQSGVAND